MEFTSENENIICGKCKRVLKSEEVHYLFNANQNLPGRKVCGECHEHYITKATTIRINGIYIFFSSHGLISNLVCLEDVEAIKKRVAVAQRGGTLRTLNWIL